MVAFGLSVAFDMASGDKVSYLILRKAAFFSIGCTTLWGLIVERARKKHETEENDSDMDFFDPSGAPNTIDEMVKQYGEPDATIVTDGTSGMAPDSTVLVYDHGGTDDKGFFIYNDLKINKSDITDMTFHRDEQPLFHVQEYTFPEKFEIVLNTIDEDHPKVFIRAGHDMELAKEILVELRQHLFIGDDL